MPPRFVPKKKYLESNFKEAKPKWWCYVYYLKEEGSDDIRYIGQTRVPLDKCLKNLYRDATRTRPNRDPNKPARSHPPLENWIRDCIQNQKTIEIHMLKENGVFNITKLSLMKLYQENGCQLLNQEPDEAKDSSYEFISG